MKGMIGILKGNFELIDSSRGMVSFWSRDFFVFFFVLSNVQIYSEYLKSIGKEGRKMEGIILGRDCFKQDKRSKYVLWVIGQNLRKFFYI